MSFSGELGVALDSSGKLMLFTSFCNGLKADISLEFDLVLGYWTSLDNILGETLVGGIGSDFLEFIEETGTEEKGGNFELVFNQKGSFVGGTLSVGYGYGPDLKFPIEFNIDQCSTYELRRIDLRAIAAKIFLSIANFLDEKIMAKRQLTAPN